MLCICRYGKAGEGVAVGELILSETERTLNVPKYTSAKKLRAGRDADSLRETGATVTSFAVLPVVEFP